MIIQPRQNTNKVYGGKELGSYYGAVILGVDIDGDGTDELFVGAPTAWGSTYDEGYVYYYGKVNYIYKMF